MDEPIRVVQWGTCNTHSTALRAILETPGLDLVGVWANNPDRTNVAELAGLNTGASHEQRFGVSPDRSLVKQRRGDFNHQALLSAVEMLPTFRYHHLVQDGKYLYGGFADEAGRRYTALSNISGELSAGLVLNTSNGQNREG